jgi:AraC-like DNA-binding protein
MTRGSLKQYPSLPVAEVAAGYGFGGVSTFYRAFRQACGVSPG